MKVTLKSVFVLTLAISAILGMVPVAQADQNIDYEQLVVNYPTKFGFTRVTTTDGASTGKEWCSNQLWVNESVKFELFLDMNRNGGQVLTTAAYASAEPFQVTLFEEYRMGGGKQSPLSVDFTPLKRAVENGTLHMQGTYTPAQAGYVRVEVKVAHGGGYIILAMYGATVRDPNDLPLQAPVPPFRIYNSPVATRGMRPQKENEHTPFDLVPAEPVGVVSPTSTIGFFVPLSDIAPTDQISGPVTIRTVFIAGDQKLTWQEINYSPDQTIDALWFYSEIDLSRILRRNLQVPLVAWFEMKIGGTYRPFLGVPVAVRF